MSKKHLIVCCNRDMRINDWTPFQNEDKFLANSFIVKKGDLISVSLDRLSLHSWELSNSFSHKQYIYFVLKKNVQSKSETGRVIAREI